MVGGDKMHINDFIPKSKEIVRAYASTHLDPSDPQVDFDIYVVWFSKTLQNAKALLSTTLYDGMYYEVTYNGDDDMIYFDAYKKFENRAIDVKEV